VFAGLCGAAANRAVMVATAPMVESHDELLRGVAPGVEDRLAAYVADVASGLVRWEQREYAGQYARGLIADGARKSLEPMVARMGGGKVQYEALQNLLADSPWGSGAD
jgi:hypothetical protein